MMRHCLSLLAAIGLLLPTSVSRAATRGEIIPDVAAAQHGLTAAWFNQIQLDRARGRVTNVTLHNDTLFVQTDQAVLHAIDALTGQTLWAEQVGSPNHPSTAPGANKDLVAVSNGSYLYVLNRYTGKLLWKTQLPGSPGGGPALSDQRVYVPMVTGLVLAYRLQPVADPMQELGKIDMSKLTAEERKAYEMERRETIRLQQDVVVPLASQSLGRAMVQPIVMRQNESEEITAWPTDKGYLYVGRISRSEQDRLSVHFRLETSGISAQPSYSPPDPRILADSGVIYTGSKDAFVHAIREKDGVAVWRFSTGEPIDETPVLIGTRLFAPTQFSGMFCLDAKRGNQLWWAPNIVQFVAASKDRAYGIDKYGAMVVLNINTGGRLDSFAIPNTLVPLANDDTDRIYLVSETGLVQCLHEIELGEPIHHAADRPQVEQAAKDDVPSHAKAEKKPPAEHKAAEHKPPAEHKAPAERKERKAVAPKVKAGGKKAGKKGADAMDAGGGAGGPNPFGG